MTVSWNLLYICLLLCATRGVSQQFQLQPLNSTVLQGSNVTFSATVNGKWEVMTWNVGGLQVLSILSDGQVPTPSGNYNATLTSSGNFSLVEFTILNVTSRQSGAVTCTVQGKYGHITAQLHVQVIGMVRITGENVTVQQDQEVEFHCVTTAWIPVPTIIWIRNGQAVNSSLYNTSSIEDGDYINSTSVLKFQAISSTEVECQATVSCLKNPQSSSVFLTVVPKPPDWTVLIAVVVSIGGFALLVLLIIGIMFCYKRRKEKQPNYQDEMRKVRTQSQLSTVNVAGKTRGQVNAGYQPDGHTSVTPSEVTDSGFCQVAGSSIPEIPDAGRPYIGADNSGFRKHRHVTIV